MDPAIKMRLNRNGQYVATIDDQLVPSSTIARVCPFADGNPDEDIIGEELYSKEGRYDPHLGRHLASYAGWVNEFDFRTNGSSGGLASWLLSELLERGLVDHVVHVAPVAGNNGHPFFQFTISSKPAEVRAGSKSRYYPIEMSGVIKQILARPGRYAIIGIPCFIKALRLASRESAILEQRIAYTIGIVCGHLKSTAFAELLAWQCGIAPDSLRSVDFRTKLPGRPASSYGVTVTGACNEEVVSITKPTSELMGANWGHNFFKYRACDFCDDVLGETADISIGDAWLPEYASDSRGTNVMVIRSPMIHSLLLAARDQGRLYLEQLSPSKVVESQAGGFRHRREGLAYRLYKEDEAARWRPQKRVKPSRTHLTPKARAIYAKRFELAERSHEVFATAKESGNLRGFIDGMAPMINAYERLYRKSTTVRIFDRLKRALRKLTCVIFQG